MKARQTYYEGLAGEVSNDDSGKIIDQGTNLIDTILKTATKKDAPKDTSKPDDHAEKKDAKKKEAEWSTGEKVAAVAGVGAGVGILGWIGSKVFHRRR